MSYAHAECARQILRLLANPGDRMTRTELNEAVRYTGKNETNFGGTLVDLVQGGILEERRIPKYPTQYIRTTKQVPGVTAGTPAPKPAPSARSTEWPSQRKGAKPTPRSYPATTARRAEIAKRMHASGNTHFTVDDVRAFGIHGAAVSNIYTDLAALCSDGRLVKIEGGIPRTWKLPTLLVDESESSFAVAAAAASQSPVAASAPAVPESRNRGGWSTEVAMQRRAKFVEILSKHPATKMELQKETGFDSTSVFNDLSWLKKHGYIQIKHGRPGAGGNSGTYSLTDKTFGAPAAVAPAAEPARAPGEAAAPAGAADPAEIAKWKEIDDALEGAYVYAKKALQLHRERKPT